MVETQLFKICGLLSHFLGYHSYALHFYNEKENVSIV